jgi:TonB family protein
MKIISTRRAVVHETCLKSAVTGALAAMVAIIMLGGCQKTERAPTTEERLKSVAEKQQTTPDFYVPRKTVDYMADLKNIRDTNPKADAVPAKEETRDSAREAAKAARLAAAANAPAPAAAPSAVVPPATTPAATPAPPPVTTPSFAPVTTTAPTPASPAARPAADATPATTSAPPPTTVASAAPTARPASPPSAPSSTASPIVSVVAREQPEFPREAVRQGVESGTVRARLTINAAGDVTNVAIVQAKPLRVFDRAVTSSLSRWKFNPGTEGRNYETEVAFQR